MLVALCNWFVDPGVMLSQEQTAELRAVLNSRDVPAVVATRARIVLWMAEGRRRKDVAELAGVSLPTVDRWVARYAAKGLALHALLQEAGLVNDQDTVGLAEVLGHVVAQIVADRVSVPLERVEQPLHPVRGGIAGGL